MILDLGRRSSAVIVDGVEQVLTLRDEQIVPPDGSLSVAGQDYIIGVARSENRLVVIMDLMRLVDVNG